MRFLDLYIDASRLLWYLPYFQAFQGTISTSTGSLNFNSVCFPTSISKFSSPNLDRILSIHRQTIFHDILQCNKRYENISLCWKSFFFNDYLGGRPQKKSKNEILHFPGAITHRLSTHKPPICFHWCILMLYAVFDNFHALANPIRQDILRGGPKIDVFVFFLTLEFEFLTTYEVSRPLHRRKLFIDTFYIFHRL